jgi:hypothetical protein
LPLLLFIILINSPQRLDTKIPFNSLGRFFFPSAININPLLAHVWSSSKHKPRPPPRAPKAAPKPSPWPKYTAQVLPRPTKGTTRPPKRPPGASGPRRLLLKRGPSDVGTLTILIGAPRLRPRRPRPKNTTRMRPTSAPVLTHSRRAFLALYSLITHETRRAYDMTQEEFILLLLPLGSTREGR